MSKVKLLILLLWPQHPRKPCSISSLSYLIWRQLEPKTLIVTLDFSFIYNQETFNLPGSSVGSASEYIQTTSHHFPLWSETPSALSWLKATTSWLLSLLLPSSLTVYSQHWLQRDRLKIWVLSCLSFAQNSVIVLPSLVLEKILTAIWHPILPSSHLLLLCHPSLIPLQTHKPPCYP